ncbi:hypothetical protein BWZ22_01585 [Seonamhaeicola sp. S2-3]|nr:hypothetical protein BWZ22_01585 [Seonamhaeicola sp. S2-3]
MVGLRQGFDKASARLRQAQSDIWASARLRQAQSDIWALVGLRQGFDRASTRLRQAQSDIAQSDKFGLIIIMQKTDACASVFFFGYNNTFLNNFNEL